MKKKYQRKPEVVDAVQWLGHGDHPKENDRWELIRPGMWIVTHGNGDIEVLGDAEFKNKYDERGRMMTEIRTDRMAELIANLNKNQAWTSSEAFEVYNEITRLEDKLYKVTRACVCLDCGKTTVIDPEKPELAYTELKAHSLVCEKNPHIKAITQLKAEIARLEGVVEELQKRIKEFE